MNTEKILLRMKPELKNFISEKAIEYGYVRRINGESTANNNAFLKEIIGALKHRTDLLEELIMPSHGHIVSQPQTGPTIMGVSPSDIKVAIREALIESRSKPSNYAESIFDD